MFFIYLQKLILQSILFLQSFFFTFPTSNSHLLNLIQLNFLLIRFLSNQFQLFLILIILRTRNRRGKVQLNINILTRQFLQSPPLLRPIITFQHMHNLLNLQVFSSLIPNRSCTILRLGIITLRSNQLFLDKFTILLYLLLNRE